MISRLLVCAGSRDLLCSKITCYQGAAVFLSRASPDALRSTSKSDHSTLHLDPLSLTFILQSSVQLTSTWQGVSVFDLAFYQEV